MNVNIKVCHHHGFTVKNVQRSAAFYRDVFELELVRISDRSNIPSYDRMLGYEDVVLRVAILRHPVNDFLLELIEYVHPPGEALPLENRHIGASHLAFEVRDADACYQRLSDAGGRWISPPTDIVRDGRRVARGMYALDPDGISIELFEQYQDVVEQ